MAGLVLYVNGAETTLVAATAKTLLQVKAPTNQRLVVKGLKFMGKMAAGGTDPVVKIRLTRSTANFGTGTGATPAKANPSNGETVQSTAAGNFTVEPTSPTDGGLQWELQPQSGVIEFIPPGVWIDVPGGQSAQFEATSSGTPILCATAIYEE
jgi:hypothetical protein